MILTVCLITTGQNSHPGYLDSVFYVCIHDIHEWDLQLTEWGIQSLRFFLYSVLFSSVTVDGFCSIFSFSPCSVFTAGWFDNLRARPLSCAGSYVDCLDVNWRGKSFRMRPVGWTLMPSFIICKWKKLRLKRIS